MHNPRSSHKIGLVEYVTNKPYLISKQPRIKKILNLRNEQLVMEISVSILLKRNLCEKFALIRMAAKWHILGLRKITKLISEACNLNASRITMRVFWSVILTGSDRPSGFLS